MLAGQYRLGRGSSTGSRISSPTAAIVGTCRMRNSAHGSPPAWSITMRHASRRIQGGDEMLGSLGGRSRHHSGVFERATQAHGGVVRAVRAQHGGHDSESGQPEAADVPMGLMVRFETAAPVPGLQDTGTGQNRVLPEFKRHKLLRYKCGTKNQAISHTIFSRLYVLPKFFLHLALDSLANIRFEITRSM